MIYDKSHHWRKELCLFIFLLPPCSYKDWDRISLKIYAWIGNPFFFIHCDIRRRYIIVTHFGLHIVYLKCHSFTPPSSFISLDEILSLFDMSSNRFVSRKWMLLDYMDCCCCNRSSSEIFFFMLNNIAFVHAIWY